ncbi:hypothetical protein TELCIR_05824 [Teladorsagia circumcincta]|uniref:Uncharacterized protein n=1 Tax=Teladorsagia circumcincta TaxID=45464 RepID=A0A2G9URZ0_TELCI|nr:hypothetical protein TELCIR_05824 [Teladorsagia circumcincta]
MIKSGRCTLVFLECSNESTSKGNGQENGIDEPRPSKSVDLFSEASSLHEKMLSFSEDLNALIKRRKRTDAECRQTALEISASPRALSGNI